LNGALTLLLTGLNRDSKDFLLGLRHLHKPGYNFITRNVGSMSNKGFEFALNYNGKGTKDFHYGIGLTFTSIQNELTSITSGTDFVQILAV
jgi:hypothetical protein